MVVDAGREPAFCSFTQRRDCCAIVGEDCHLSFDMGADLIIMMDSVGPFDVETADEGPQLKV